MKVYHSGTDIIEQPIVNIGRPNLDFGRGFYLTDIIGQAERWGKRMALHRRQPTVMNVYDLDLQKAATRFRYRKFAAYDIEWLRFIVNNRQGGDDWKSYDIIEGGVADDRVIDTVELYIGGYLPEEAAIERLRHFAPNNQFCITNQQLADECLQFVESYKIENF